MEQTNDFQELTTPCFILDKQELGKSIKSFQLALDSHFHRAIVGYSVKTNSVPYCLKIAKDNNAFAEVVSHDEYQLAIHCGFKKNQIIYKGPMKSKETFLDAVTHGAVVNLETKRELQWLKDLPLEGEYKVGVRLNGNISQISPEDAEGDNDNSRFGFSDDTDEFRKVIEAISELPNVQLAGLHIHRTAHSRSIRFYKRLVERACQIIKKYNLHLDYLDIGGGYFGIFPNKPTFQEYSDGFYQVIKQNGLEHLTVIVEPGNALVASCFQFLSEVIDVKHVEIDTYFVTTDGSRNDIDPFFRKTEYIREFLRKAQSNDIVKTQIIGGCTCLENDRLFTIYEKPLLELKDRILYKNVGAYTMCLTPLFIRYIPKIYVMTNNEYTLIREQWTVDEYVSKSIL